MAMQDSESQKQIHQMINFILNEARDKAQEIEAKAIEDFNIEKLKLVQQMKHKVREEFKLKSKKLETERLIVRSNAANQARLKKMDMKFSLVNQVIADTTTQLTKTLSHNTTYKNLCINLIVQGLLKLLEDAVYVRCRPEDEALIKECLPLASAKFSNTLKEQAHVNRSVVIQIDKEYHLPPGAKSPSVQTSGTCCGGVILSSIDRRILVDNTLDARLQSITKNKLPALRCILFPEPQEKN
ncbi:V-type proton ATPase subunit E 2-like [Hylaeus volcanicus]|uniref:V-type proton ATPase subunit E 2-like n=1 Tax=Hylaeus volcanicus TaxID=313075 RepID=UPI0023B80B1B|nr:V-type proton ATPase subunit E 2-like [Hylaeus volcanicus]